MGFVNRRRTEVTRICLAYSCECGEGSILEWEPPLSMTINSYLFKLMNSCFEREVVEGKPSTNNLLDMRLHC